MTKTSRRTEVVQRKKPALSHRLLFSKDWLAA